jgi:hypothetical protein
MTTTSATTHTRRRTRWSLALLLVLLTPICAEYITGYDSNTGSPLDLARALLIHAPLYGAPALLIRELARRHDIGWPGILSLATALGIVQAGIIDQSMFSQSYRDIDYWGAMVAPTWVAPLGLSVNAAAGFVLGHTVWSFGVPIAMTEAVGGPARHHPWLRLPGLIVTVVLYLAAAWLVLREHLTTESDHASAGQLAGSAATAVVLVVVAFNWRRFDRNLSQRRAPHPMLLAGLGIAGGAAVNFSPPTWLGVALIVAPLAVVAVAAAWWSGMRGWTPRHVVALAGGLLLVRAAVAFLAVPLGDVSVVAKYGHNVFFGLMALLVWWWAARRSRSAVTPPASAPSNPATSTAATGP